MEFGPSVSCIVYFTIRRFLAKKGKQTVDKALGRDRSLAEQMPRQASIKILRDQLSFPEVTLHIFSVLVFITVSNAPSSSIYLKHGTLHGKYMSLE